MLNLHVDEVHHHQELLVYFAVHQIHMAFRLRLPGLLRRAAPDILLVLSRIFILLLLLICALSVVGWDRV